MADNVDLAQLALDQTLPDPVPYGLPFARDCSLVKGVPRFLARTYELVSDPATDYCIAWSREGTSFIIHDRDALIKDVLAQFFSHANLASFIRQINMYSMRKVGPASTQEFFHPAFIRGHPNLLKYIKRRRGVNAAAAAAAGGSGGSAPMDTSATGGGASPPAPQIAKQIAVLKHERVELEEDIAMLRETQAAMESQLDRVVGANLLLREELKAALAQQQRMQATVSEIMRLLPAAAASGVFASTAAVTSAPITTTTTAASSAAGATTKRSRAAADLGDDAAERPNKRPRVDTSRQGLQAAPAATMSSLPVQSPEPTSAKFLDAFFRELNGTLGATPMLMSAVLDETQHGGPAFPPAFAMDFGSTLSPLFRREKTPFSAAFFKTPAAASNAAAVAAASVAAAAAAAASAPQM